MLSVFDIRIDTSSIDTLVFGRARIPHRTLIGTNRIEPNTAMGGNVGLSYRRTTQYGGSISPRTVRTRTLPSMEKRNRSPI